MMARRLVLRGAGSVAIALPLVPVARRHAAAAAAPDVAPVPRRFLTFFFGNGLPPEYTAGGLAGPLAALAPFAPRVTLLRGIEAASPKEGTQHPHVRGGAAFAVGRPSDSLVTAAGKSLDVLAHEAHRPPTPLSTLAMSLYHWEIEPVRHIHSWRGPNQPNPGIRRPLALFHRLFGGAELGGPQGGAIDPALVARLRKQRYRRSVLDSVVSGYRSLTGEASGLGPAMRARLADHLETVRSLERRALALDERAASGAVAAACRTPQAPPDVEPTGTCAQSNCPTTPAGQKFTWDEVWPLNAELFALALRCDLVRHGNLTCTAAGDRYSLYDLPAMVHDLAHAWRPDQESQFVRSVAWVMGNLATFLRKLDDPSHAEPGGGTVLDHTLILAGTEISNPAVHSFDDLSYLLIGGGGAFRTGTVELGNRATDVDLYRTVARAVGIREPVGDDRFFRGFIDGVVAG